MTLHGVKLNMFYGNLHQKKETAKKAGAPTFRWGAGRTFIVY